MLGSLSRLVEPLLGRRRELLAGAAGSLVVTASLGLSSLGVGAQAATDAAPTVRVTRTSDGVAALPGSQTLDPRPLAPGESVATTLRFDAEGSRATELVLTPSVCTARTTDGAVARVVRTGGQDLCDVLRFSVFRGGEAVGRPLFDGTMAEFSVPLVFAVRGDPEITVLSALPGSASTEVQGQRVSQPLSWAFRR